MLNDKPYECKLKNTIHLRRFRNIKENPVTKEKIVVEPADFHLDTLLVFFHDLPQQKMLFGIVREIDSPILLFKAEDYDKWKEDNLGFALNLFSVADRFLVTELRDLCTDVILRGIRVENVSKIYSMADRRMLHDLRRKCLFFMMNHFSKVITTKEFSLMEPVLIQEILTEASKRGVFLRTLP